MGAIPTFDTAPLDSALAASLLEWWHDAGVDLLVEDEPRDWMAEPIRPVSFAPPSAPQSPAAPHPLAPIDLASWCRRAPASMFVQGGKAVPAVSPPQRD